VRTIRAVSDTYGVVIDPHTADGIKVARDFVRPGVPMIVTETALPVKFSATIVEAIGIEPDRPAAFEGLEDLPRHVIGLPNDAEALKALIAART
jgi:threonine synthase